MLKGLRNAMLLMVVGLALGGCHSIHRFTQSCNKDTDRYQQAINVAGPSLRTGFTQRGR